MSTPKNLAILIFDEVEVLDFCGPFEVFSVTAQTTEPVPFAVYTVAEKAGPVLARNQLSVNPRYTIADCPQPDILLVPGGQGTRKEMHNQALLEWIKDCSSHAELLSISTSAISFLTPCYNNLNSSAYMQKG